MAITTTPSLTETINNQFLETWYEIRPKAIDNILNASVVWALLKAKGCFTPQVGGRFIERTIRHTIGPDVIEVQKGDTHGSGEVETETAAFWTQRIISTHVQRDIVQDSENAGPSKIKSYVERRLTEARDALNEKFRTVPYNTFVSGETGKAMQGLNDLLPSTTDRTTSTYGKITKPTAFAADTALGVTIPSTGNTFWGSRYLQWTAPMAVNLKSQMTTMFNACHNNQEAPDMIITTKTIHELYEEFAEDKTQIIKDAATKMADLGFSVLRFKGQTLTWAAEETAGNMRMLNSKYIEVVYDPNLWFYSTPWKYIPNMTTAIMHFLCKCNIIGTQPRRHGLLYT